MAEMLVVAVITLLFLNTVFSVSAQIMNASASNNCSCTEQKHFTNSNLNCTTPLMRLLVLLPCYRGTESFPVEGSTSWNCYSHDILPALSLAMEQINNRSNFLPCHKLELVDQEAGCEITTSTLTGLTRGLFPSDSERSGIVGVIGPTCSLSSIQTSNITNRPEVQMVLLHSSGISLLTDRKKYPFSLGILGSTAPIVNLLLALMQKSNWHNIDILYDTSSFYYHSLMREFLDTLNEDVNIKFLSSVTSNFYPLDQVKISGTRIVFVFTPPGRSYRIICLAYHMKLVYPRYQWIFVNKRLGNFMNVVTGFTYRGRYYSCSERELVNSILEGALLVDYRLLTTNDPDVINYPQGISLKVFQELYTQKLSNSNQKHSKEAISDSTTPWAYGMYDAVWAWGMVLDKLTRRNSKLAFKYGDKHLAEVILKEFYTLDFQGMSGHISFSVDSGVVDRLVNLYQITNGCERHIASANSSVVTVVAPQDFNTIHDVARAVALPHMGIVVFFLVTHCVELFTVVVLHLITFLYRNTKFVKASSPKLVQPAFIGVYFLVAGAILSTSFYANELSTVIGTIICQAVWVWLFPISFTLMMGIITLRVWRLYRIFKHYMNPGKFISNRALLTILSVMVLLDVIIAIVWTISDPMHFQFVEYKVKNGQTYELIIDQSCVSTHNITPLWIGTVFTYKIGLLVVMIILSVLTHQIPNQTFSTALLRLFAYVFSAAFAIGFSLYYLFLFLNRKSNIDFYILNVLLSVLLLSFVALVIVPPLLPVIKHKLNIF